MDHQALIHGGCGRTQADASCWMLNAFDAANVYMKNLSVRGAPGRLVKLLGLVSTE